MKTASSLFALILLGSLIADAAAQVGPNRPRPPGHQGPQQPPQQQPIPQQPGQPLPPYTQPGYQQQSQVISERVMMNLQIGQRVGISELLRLSPSEEQQLEVRAITLTASALRGQAQLDILSRGMPVSGMSQVVGRQLQQIRVILPLHAELADLEIISAGEIFLDTISAEVESQWGPGPGPIPGPGYGQLRQPMSGEALTLTLRQSTRGYGSIDLDQILELHQRVTLEGASIDRIIVRGTSLMYGRSASVQVELNGRPVGPAKILNPRVAGVPLPIKTGEEVRSLRLIVSGDAQIDEVSIVVGMVRPIMIGNQRISVMQEISAQRPLSLAQLLPYETRLVTSIVIEASTRLRGQQAQVALIGFSGQILGSALVGEIPTRQVIQLMRPTSLRELSLQSLSPVRIESLELGLGHGQVGGGIQYW